MSTAAGKDTIDDSAAPLIEHLAELRNRIIYSMLAFVAAFILAFVFWNPIFNVLIRPMCVALNARHQECALILVKPQEGFFVAIRIAMIGGFALAFPIIGYQMWRFVAPGLYRSEKGAFLPFLVASPVMFFLGAGFAYYVILPFAFNFFLDFQQGFAPAAEAVADAVAGVAPLASTAPVAAGGAAEAAAAVAGVAEVKFQGSMEHYLQVTLSFVMAFGLCFQLPVLLTLMGRAGIVSSAGLKGVRRYAVVGILVLAAIVTPPDVASQIILFAVIYPLYEISILLVARFERDRERLQAEEEAAEAAEAAETAGAAKAAGAVQRSGGA